MVRQDRFNAPFRPEAPVTILNMNLSGDREPVSESGEQVSIGGRLEHYPGKLLALGFEPRQKRLQAFKPRLGKQTLKDL